MDEYARVVQSNEDRHLSVDQLHRPDLELKINGLLQLVSESVRVAIEGRVLTAGHPVFDEYVGKPSPVQGVRNLITYFDADIGHKPCRCGCGEEVALGEWIAGQDQRALHARMPHLPPRSKPRDCQPTHSRDRIRFTATQTYATGFHSDVNASRVAARPPGAIRRPVNSIGRSRLCPSQCWTVAGPTSRCEA